MMLQEANKMATLTLNTADPMGHAGMCPSLFEPFCYAVYAKPNHEKRVAQQLGHDPSSTSCRSATQCGAGKTATFGLRCLYFRGMCLCVFVLRDRLQVLQPFPE